MRLFIIVSSLQVDNHQLSPFCLAHGDSRVTAPLEHLKGQASSWEHLHAEVDDVVPQGTTTVITHVPCQVGLTCGQPVAPVLVLLVAQGAFFHVDVAVQLRHLVLAHSTPPVKPVSIGGDQMLQVSLAAAPIWTDVLGLGRHLPLKHLLVEAGPAPCESTSRLVHDRWESLSCVKSRHL